MSKIVDLTFRLNDKVTTPLSKINASLMESNQQWQRAGRSIQRTGKSISKVGSSLTKSLTVPLVGAGTAAVTKFAEVDKTMTLVESTMGETKFAAADLNAAMQEAAANSTFGMNDAATAALNFARGGWDAEQAASALAPAMNLAAGEGGNLDTVSAGLMATMNSFGAAADEASHYSDVFAAACNNSALDVDSLSSAMSVAAPIFQASGSDVENAALAMGIMANAGIDADKAATSLKTGIARLAAPTSEAAEAMESLGISAFDSEGNLKDITQLQSELSSAFSTLSGQEQEAAAAAIFGKNQMAPWLALINSAPDDVAALSASIEDCNDLTTKMADDMMSGFGGSLEKLKSSVDVLATSLGETLAPYISKVSDVIQQAVDRFNSLDDKQKDTIVRIGMVVAAIGPALLIFGGMVTKIGSVISTVGRFGQALKRAGSLMALITSPAGIAVAAVAGVAAVALLVIKNWDKIKPVVQEVGAKFAEIGAKFQELWSLIGPLVVGLGQTIASVFTGVIGAACSALTGAFTNALSVVSGVLSGITLILGGLIDFVTGVFTGNWSKAWEGVKSIFSGIFESLVAVAKAPINAVISVINGAISGINKIGVKIPDWVPAVGGKDFSVNIPKIPTLAVGTTNWQGGVVQISERGGEIVDLPQGSRVYPHDDSVRRAYQDGARNSGVVLNMPKLADSIVIREDSDIVKIANAIGDMLLEKSQNMGGLEIGYSY